MSEGDNEKGSQKGGLYKKIGNPTDASEFPTDLLRQISEETGMEFPVESDSKTGKPFVRPQIDVVVPAKKKK